MPDIILGLIYIVATIPFFAIVIAALLGLRRLFPASILEIARRFGGHEALVVMWCFTTGLAAAILISYAVGRFMGWVPSPAIWPENHGPWRNTFAGVILWSTLAVLVLSIPAALLTGFGLALSRRKPGILVRGIGLAAICASYLGICGHVLFWTID